MSEPLRIVLGVRAPRRDHAVAFEADAFVVEGVALLPDRRVALRDVYGIERSGGRLWIGAGCVPVVLGGADAPPERLARIEAELRARIGALPDGPGRLARLDARRPLWPHRPWLTAALVLGLGVAAGSTGLRAATDLLLLLAFGLVAEAALGAVRLALCGAAALLAARICAAGGATLALAPLALALGWAGLLAFVRLRHEPTLGVRTRSALGGSLWLAPLLVVHALAAGVPARALAAAALAGVLVAPPLLRRWPGSLPPH